MLLLILITVGHGFKKFSSLLWRFGLIKLSFIFWNKKSSVSLCSCFLQRRYHEHQVHPVPGNVALLGLFCWTSGFPKPLSITCKVVPGCIMLFLCCWTPALAISGSPIFLVNESMKNRVSTHQQSEMRYLFLKQHVLLVLYQIF